MKTIRLSSSLSMMRRSALSTSCLCLHSPEVGLFSALYWLTALEIMLLSSANRGLTSPFFWR